MSSKKILIVGSGFYGSIFAYELNKRGFNVTVIDKRNHIGGNCYTRKQDDIDIHEYGPHIFHTDKKEIWDWINQFCEFENHIFSPVANYENELFSLPFNMWTFSQIWGISDPEEVERKLLEIQKSQNEKPRNLEEQAISLVGKKIYKKLIKGYTTKQWGKDPKSLPAFIIKRLPVRYTFNNNYFNDEYQGIPKNGYTEIFENLLRGIKVDLGLDFFDKKEFYLKHFDHIIYTGPIDQYFNFKFGKLEYRSLRWENEKLDKPNYQGNSVVNYTSEKIPFTRIIEHKHFLKKPVNKHSTYISREFPQDFKDGSEPYYPINDSVNNELYNRYKELGEQEQKVAFGGRLGKYKYYDMHQVIASALKDVQYFTKEL